MQMTRDFTAELKAFCKRLDSEPELIEAIENEPLFDVYKCSLPVGIHKLVYCGMTQRDMDHISRRLQTKLVNDQVIYYDVVETGKHHNIYANDKPTVKADAQEIY